MTLKSSEITRAVEDKACLSFSFKLSVLLFIKFEYLIRTLVTPHQNIFGNTLQLYFFQFHHTYLKTLLGVTGSGKTFTMAKVIEATNRPALILAPNKTLAAQLYGEMKNFFPDNAVEYFVSYYDYYTPEAYVPRSDTYIEKEASINNK